MAKSTVRRENAADPKQRRTREKSAKLRRERFDEAVDAMLRSPAGQVFIGDREFGLLALCHTFRSTFSQDAITMAYLEGRRSLGIELMRLFERVNEQAYLELDALGRARAKQDDDQLEGELARVADQTDETE